MSATKSNLNIVWIGFHEEGRYCIDKLVESGFTIDAIITLDSQAILKRSGAMDYEVIAEQHSIPLYKISHINDPASVAILKEHKPDVLFVIGWSQILSEEVLATAKYVVGAHASKLPENRGSAPINWSLIKGEKTTGNTLIELQPGVDTGDILAQREFAISFYDSCKTLYDQVAVTNAEMVLEFCENCILGDVQRVVQENKDEVVLPRRKPEHGEVNWELSAFEIYNFVRALTHPYPGAFSYFSNTKYIIWSCSWFEPLMTESVDVPGEIIRVVYSFNEENCGVLMACGDGQLFINEIEVAGRILRSKDLIRFFEGK